MGFPLANEGSWRPGRSIEVKLPLASRRYPPPPKVPTTSPLLVTGMRENPSSIVTDTNSSRVAVTGTVTMSGRGVITSRTVVSPKAKIELIISRSPVEG